MADAPAPHEVLNGLPEEAARAALERCCGSASWVNAMAARRPFASTAALHAAAAQEWDRLDRADILEAFAHHPRIGADVNELRARFGATSAWASEEQAQVKQAAEAVLEALRTANLAYQRRFGFIFIVCATGRSADEMLALLEARLPNPPDVELGVAAAEQAKITRLRLEKLRP
jgi:2-oxo-4-hydroxy-4-carboxy-5-ureidoimidazoline decarboxylase